MNFSISWIISVSLLIVSFFGTIIVAKIFTKPIDEYKFSFMRIFPFEVINNSGSASKVYSFFTYLFSGACFTPLIVLFEGPNKFKGLNPLSILICVVLGFASIIFIFIHIFDATHVKVHLNLFVIFVFLTLLSGALLFARALVSYKTCERYGHVEPLFIACEIASGIVCLVTLLTIFNPKLRTWASLDVVSEKENKYARPKKFVLAYSEWILFVLLFMNELTYFIQLLIK